MTRRSSFHLIVLVMVIVTLGSCGAREVAVTDLSQLVGLWGAEISSGMTSVMEIRSDGTIDLAAGWERYDSGSVYSFAIWVEDGKVSFQGPLECGEDVGTYEAVIGSDSILRLSVVEDPCSFRRRTLDKSEPGNLQQYELEYSRVER
jgi:hypothetical protein